MSERIRTVSLFLVIFFLGYYHTQGQRRLPVLHSSNEIEQAADIDTRLDLLTENARYYHHLIGDFEKADSIVILALDLMENEDVGEERLARVCEIALNYGNLRSLETRTKVVARKLALSEDDEIRWQGLIFLNAISRANYKREEALKYATDAARKGMLMNDAVKEALGYLHVGVNQETRNQKVEALENYLRAQEILTQTNNVDAQYQVNDHLINFYFFIKDLERATEMLDKQSTLLKASVNKDSLDALQLEWYHYYLVYLKAMEGKADVDEKEVYAKLSFCQENGLRAKKNQYLSLLRSHFISENNFEGLYHLYIEDFPEEYWRIKQHDKALYYRMQAYFFEFKGEIDSAASNWHRVLNTINEDDNNMLANIYIRFGEFYVRNGGDDNAIEAYHKAYALAEEAATLIFMLNSTQALEKIFYRKGMFKTAYEFSERRHVIEDSLSRVNENEKFKLTEVIHYNKIKQAEADHKIQSQSRTNTMLGVGLVVVLMFAGIAFYQYRQTRVQKQRSEELLLNILPKETALELREKGRTEAHRYNDVTVLFADVVGFSKVAEGMEPGELVKRIDRYFGAFDDLMTIYGLEKIKTIGDAYVAVAGLPKGNTATAFDAVRVGLSMLRVTEEINAEYEGSGLKLRIGLNTGDVVAGVVGSKKFQFDIWGDAVNIAARMEQNSEPGKVNISESTYQQVKSKFNCSKRGKISAKNKGELEMYFVDGPTMD